MEEENFDLIFRQWTALFRHITSRSAIEEIWYSCGGLSGFVVGQPVYVFPNAAPTPICMAKWIYRAAPRRTKLSLPIAA